LTRIAADIPAAGAESQTQLNSVVWLRRARAAAAALPGPRDDDIETTSRRLG
jgi:hypothetical protein